MDKIGNNTYYSEMPQPTPQPAPQKIQENKLNNANSLTKRRPWGTKRRLRQARIARKTRPWARSTGPRTAAGKAAVARNALKISGRRAEIRALHALLSRQARFHRALERAFRTGIYPPGLHAEGVMITIQLRQAVNAVNLSP